MLDEKIIDRLKELGFNIEDSEVTYVNILKWLAAKKGILVRIHGHWDFDRELPIYKIGFTVKKELVAENITVDESFLTIDEAFYGVICEILDYLDGRYDE